MHVDAALPICVQHAELLAEKVFGFVPYDCGYGIRVKSKNFQKVLAQVNAEKM